jgi:hypothetical protein
MVNNFIQKVVQSTNHGYCEINYVAKIKYHGIVPRKGNK